MIGDIKFDRHRLKHAQMVHAQRPTPMRRIRFIMFFTANSETPEPIDYDRALIRAINVSAMLAGVSAIAIPAAFSASIFSAAVPFPPDVIAPA